MRLGAPLTKKFDDPAAWAAAVRAKGYRAAFCPLPLDADADAIRAYRAAAAAQDLVIAEVGAWSNPLSPDAAEQAAAISKCQRALHLADEIGARCCVNIAGSRGRKWAGPDARDLTNETFALIVATVRTIIDEVQPRNACYALETMPWAYPDSVESYAQLLHAIDRPQCAVHFDPVNLVNSPARYFHNAELIRAFVRELGPQIRSVHVKDILLDTRLTVHLDEVRPGLGGLDHAALLHALAPLDADLPLLLEHLPDETEYDLAAAHLRAVAQNEGLSL